jgi:hypothetical protein
LFSGQARPQAPQFSASVLGSVQAPPQHTRPAGQAAPVPQRHVPLEQVSPSLHAWSQLPQLAGSDARSAHPVAQQVSLDVPSHRAPVPHLHRPPSQEPAAGGQAASQAPQCSGDDARSTHSPWQHCSPPVHGGLHSGSRHTPSEQVSPAAQGASHRPQLSRSVKRSTQRSSSQQVSPSSHGG